MSCPVSCRPIGVYKFKPISYGTPAPTYVRLLARQNGQVVDKPRGYQFSPCDIPCESACPAPLDGTAPVVTDNPSVPTDVVGTDNYLLATPDSWAPVEGQPGKVYPVYNSAP